ncbi:MAG: hypothetical protein WC517_04270, partial [Patescibacteria group bacterium]
MMKRSVLFPVRFVAFFTAAVFTWTQTVFAVGESPYEQYQSRPVQSSVEVPGGEGKISRPERAPDTSLDFLSGKNSPLSLPEKPRQNISIESQTQYEAAESSFDDAVVQFSPDYASAVVVKSLSAQNLRELKRLDVEVGIAVIRGKIVMFTTGSREELRANPVVQSILSESSIIIHTHPQGTQATPSMFDVYLAGETAEYLLSNVGIQAYNSNGIIASDLSEDDLIDLLETNHTRDVSSTEARNVLNSFIAEIDKYNSDPAQYSVYRSAGSITWIAAPSNPDYVVTVVYLNGVWVGGIKRNGAPDSAASIFATSSSNNYQGVFDISPDGSTIFYGIGDTIYAQRVSDPNQKVSVAGRYTSISFREAWAKLTWISNGVTSTAWLNVQTAETRNTDPFALPPGGSIKINNEAAYTTSPNVTLNLAINSGTYGLSQMRFSLDGGANWTGWETYSATKNLALPSGDGTKEIRCQVSDTAGNTSIFSDTITLDTAAPAIVVNSGTPTLINTRTLTINYTADGVAKSKTFSGLAEGGNTLTITETDTAGNQAIKTWNVTVDTTAPVVVVNAGTATLINVRTLTINYTADGAARSKAFSGLAEGGNTLTITETDAAGNQSVKNWSVTVDTTAPVLAIDPATPSLINTKSLTVSYTSEGVQKTKSFTNLTEGINTLTITEKDDAGNQTNKTWNVRVDTFAPVVAIDSATPAIINTKSLTVNYTADGVSRSKVFEGFSEGENILSLTETDLAGNETVKTLKVTVDTIPPVLVITSKTILARDPGYSLYYTVDGNASVVFRALVEGLNTLTVTSADLAGNVATASINVTLDTTAPTGSIDVNSGAQYANSRSVILNLSGMDTGSGMDRMSFSTNGVNWTTAEGYVATKNFTLPSGDGNKTVYVKYYDKAGIASPVYSKSILLDQTAPTGSIDINSGAQYTSSRSVTLNLSGADTGYGVDRMSFSTDSVTWTPPEAYSSTKALTLPPGDGNKTVYVKYYDMAGNASARYAKSILVDQTAPTGSMNINSGAAHTVSSTVTLSLNAEDAVSGIGQMRFSIDGGTSWTAWENYAATKLLTISDGNGEKTVCFQVQDKTGNFSEVYSGKIILDTTPPVIVLNASTPSLINTGTLTISYTVDGLAETRSFSGLPEGENTLVVTEADVAGNQSSAQWTVTVDALPPVIGIASPVIYTQQNVYELFYTVDGVEKHVIKTLQTGENLITISESNAFGNKTNQTAKIYLDAQAPAGNLKINQDDSETDSRIVILSAEMNDATPLASMRFSTDGGAHWTTWETYQSFKTLELPVGEGTKTVLCQVKDSAGNIGGFSDTIFYTTTPRRPVVTITSPNGTDQELYTLTYTVNGEAR